MPVGLHHVLGHYPDCVEKHEQVARGDDWRYRHAGTEPKLPYS